MDSTDEEKVDLQKNKLKWTDQVENIFISWADKAIVYKILHEKAYKKNKLKNYAFTIPCVVLSTVLASATFALSGDSNTIPKEYSTYAQYGLGGVNIFIGILQTLQNFFKYAQMSEAHDSVSKQWYKLYRGINTELNIARNKRRDADEFMKFARLEFDRLIELSPDIPDNIVKSFKDNYIKKPDDVVDVNHKKEKISINGDNTLELPDICGTISHTRAYRFDDIEEEAEKKGDAFDELVKRISNNMNATTYLFGNNRSRPQTPASSNLNLNQPYTLSSTLIYDKQPTKPNTPVNNSDVRVEINDTPVPSPSPSLNLPTLPNDAGVNAAGNNAAGNNAAGNNAAGNNAAGNNAAGNINPNNIV
jgi:hypothetical protein